MAGKWARAPFFPGSATNNQQKPHKWKKAPSLGQGEEKPGGITCYSEQRQSTAGGGGGKLRERRVSEGSEITGFAEREKHLSAWKKKIIQV